MKENGKADTGTEGQAAPSLPPLPFSFFLFPFSLRLPLFARILGWSFLNLALLVVVFWVLLRSEFRLEPLIAGVAGERAQRTADALLAELRERPSADWDAVLARQGEVFGVQFLIVRDDGQHVAGPEMKLPASVAARLRSRGGGGRGGPGAGDGPRGEPPAPTDARPREDPERFRPFGEVRRRPPTEARGFLHTTEPSRYWLMFEAPLPGGGGGPERRMTRLLIVADTLGAGGLFFDFRPWIWAGTAVVVLSVLWWVPFVRGITRALGQMTRATEQVAEGRFDVSVDARRGDELGRLGGAINRMAERLAGFVTGQKRFLGDIAHELCTPLARMELALGVLEQRADDRQRAYVDDVREEVRHMSGLVNELLSFSKAGLKARDLPLAAVPLPELVAQVVAREAAPGADVRVEVAGGLVVQADPELLARAIGNLLRNALRYAGHAGPVTLRALAEGDHVSVTIADVGPGVPPEALLKLGEPFFRPDAARTREEGGTGLGLAIVRTCAEACRGTVTFRNRQPTGLEAELKLRRAWARGGGWVPVRHSGSAPRPTPELEADDANL